jgi:hypothetical protein
MTNLLEMMLQAQGGNAVQNLSRQFGLSPDQAQAGIEALLPALSMGMQRQAQSADGLKDLVAMFGGGRFSQFHDADGDGIPDSAAGQGNDVLGQIFGSKDVSRAIAAQASGASGISDAILKQMMPVIAAMVMGGLFKGAANSGLGGLLGQMAQGNPGGAMNAPPRPQAADPMGGLMGGLLGQMMGGLMGQKPAPPPPPAPSTPMEAGLDLLKSMMQSGATVQQGYQNSLQSIFEQFAGRR